MANFGIVRQASWMWGGAFHYELAMMDALAEISAALPDNRLTLFPFSGEDMTSLIDMGGVTYKGLPVANLGSAEAVQPPLEELLRHPPAEQTACQPDQLMVTPSLARLLRQNGVDILLQLAPGVLGASALLPFIMPIHDLNHLLQPEFPEVSAFGETAMRNHMYRTACRYATLILVDSEVGKEDVLRFYGDVIDAERIRILPFCPAIRQEPEATGVTPEMVRRKYSLPEKYFFYPAQFWKHKNHEVLIRALDIARREQGLDMHLVLCGTYADYLRAVNFVEMMGLAQDLRVADRVHYLGRVPDQDMPSLYRLARGLAMPTFFGPTNIPPLEAWHYGIPVISSDIRGVREQIGEAGLLVDPRSPEAMAQAMARLWTDDALCGDLVGKGRARLRGQDRAAFVETLRVILMEAGLRVRLGLTPAYPRVSL